ncbi:PAS domain-containing sensor histidine kinase [Pontibacter russatus]|uniref:PAS domain-containing sensor histidine kinase n=1 Tax=Pontibacter russatus TaxID=2694929 RepID=UPI001379E7A7|nr:PAS domain-containing sensor histidine kinase [Pontibacter russatus]
MNNDLFHQFGASNKKIIFLFNLGTMQFDYLNNAVEHIWKLDRQAVLESPVRLITHVHPDDRKAVARRYGLLLEEGVSHELEFSLKLPDGGRKEVKANAHPLRNAEGELTHIAGDVEDVTKQSQYVDYLREYTRRKDSALEIIAHDLRGPLAIVKGIASLLESEHREKNYEEVSTYTTMILEAYDNCLGIITDVMKDEHLRSPMVYVNPQRFDLVELVRRLMHSFQVAKGMDYRFEVVTEQEKIMVELDEVKLMQVLNNLIANSIKFTADGGGITIELRVENNRLLLLHSDNGIGIPEELQPHIFERYSNMSRIGLRGEPTNGVGLSIVRELVEVQGGKIWVESQGENQGTTFYLSFPLPEE